MAHAAASIDEPFPEGCPPPPSDLGTCCWAWWIDEHGVEHTAVRSAARSRWPGAHRRALARLVAVNQHHLDGIRHLVTEGTDQTPLRGAFLRDANPLPAFLRPPVVVWSDVGEPGRWEPQVLATAHDDLCARLGLLTDLPWRQRVDVRASVGVAVGVWVLYLVGNPFSQAFGGDAGQLFVALFMGLMFGLVAWGQARQGMRPRADRRFWPRRPTSCGAGQRRKISGRWRR